MPADDARPVPPVLIVGHGLIGAAVRAVLLAQGVTAVCIGRRLAPDPGCRAYDLASEAGRAALHAAVTELRPGCLLLTHGPSDVTWIDENEAAAAAVHGGVAKIAARAGVPVVLVSTDNVFPGARGRYDADDPVEPANGYGRVKALAESVLLASGPVLVLRVSLIYGWAGPGLRATFAQRCLDAAVEGRSLSAPTDQMFTPIHVSDVATVLAAVCQAGSGLVGIRHLAGPTELSRYEFARLAYGLAGADQELVRPCLRRDTEWACRPQFSSLACGIFADVRGLAAWRPLTPDGGLREMLATRRELLATGPAPPAGGTRSPGRLPQDDVAVTATAGGEPKWA